MMVIMNIFDLPHFTKVLEEHMHPATIHMLLTIVINRYEYYFHEYYI